MNKIVIITTLKPCNEVRIYERFAISLAKPNKYEINIIGLAPKKLQNPLPGIHFHYIHNHGRNVNSRIKSLLEVWKYLRKIKPEIFIITTPVLLVPALIFKSIYHGKIIYDIQEDYYKTILFQKLYSRLNRWILSNSVRLVERICSPFIDHFFLAEKCYEKNLSFIETRYTLLENKFADIHHIKPGEQKTDINLLFTGVISEYSGIQTALATYKKWKKIQPGLSLTIAGFTYQKEIAEMLKNENRTDPAIKLYGIDYFLDHHQIVELITASHVGFVCHQYNVISQEKIPTKLFEYAYLHLPYLVHKDSHWEKTGKIIGGAIGVHFDKINYHEIEKIILKPEKLFNQNSKKLSDWFEEEPKLIKSINKLTREI